MNSATGTHQGIHGSWRSVTIWGCGDAVASPFATVAATSIRCS
jgi:hypothetical protein